MTLKPILLAGLLLILGACANVPDYPALRNVQVGSDAAMMLTELERVAALSPEQRRRELAALESGRVDDLRRFQAAALLDREDSVEALERGLKNLNALSGIDDRAQPLVEQMKKSFKARIELKAQTARAQELQEKLDQIKALEKSLQQRAAPPAKP
jgi:hypothetical protein